VTAVRPLATAAGCAVLLMAAVAMVPGAFWRTTAGSMLAGTGGGAALLLLAAAVRWLSARATRSAAAGDSRTEPHLPPPSAFYCQLGCGRVAVGRSETGLLACSECAWCLDVRTAQAESRSGPFSPFPAASDNRPPVPDPAFDDFARAHEQDAPHE
jgi:hypothetical protein